MLLFSNGARETQQLASVKNIVYTQCKRRYSDCSEDISPSSSLCSPSSSNVQLEMFELYSIRFACYSFIFLSEDTNKMFTSIFTCIEKC